MSGLTTIGLIRRGTPSRNRSLGLNQRIQRVQCGNNAILFPSLALYMSRRLNLTTSSVLTMNYGVFHLGDRRTGSKTDSATSSHMHACSTFEFSSGSSFPRRIGKFSSCLELNFPHLSANWTQRFRRDIFSLRSRSLTTADYAQRASCACCKPILRRLYF